MKSRTRRGKASLLLLLLINLTACFTWQPVTGIAVPAQVVKQVETYPAKTIRIRVPGEPLLEVASPLIEGDQLVGFVEEQRFSTPLSDIAMLEIRHFDLGKTVGTLGLGYVGLTAFVYSILKIGGN